MPETVRLVGDRQREYAKRLIDEAPQGHVMKLAAETRRDVQNRKLHAMLGDLQRQVPEMATFSIDDLRLRFLNALGTEMRFLPTLEGEGMFPCGMKSSTLTVHQFAALIQLIEVFGAKREVVWTDPRWRDE